MQCGDRVSELSDRSACFLVYDYGVSNPCVLSRFSGKLEGCFLVC